MSQADWDVSIATRQSAHRSAARDCDTGTLLHPRTNVSAPYKSSSSTMVKERLQALLPEVYGTDPLRLLPWKFANECVANHRWSVALTCDHSQHHYTNWHFPEYFSSAPVPPLSVSAASDASSGSASGGADSKRIITCLIRCMPEDQDDAGGADTADDARRANALAIRHTKVGICASDTVAATLQKALVKFKLSGGEQDYCLKVSGRAEFLTGRRLFFSYDAVRSAIRDQKPLEFVVVHKATLRARNEAERTHLRAGVLATMPRDGVHHYQTLARQHADTLLVRALRARRAVYIPAPADTPAKPSHSLSSPTAALDALVAAAPAPAPSLSTSAPSFVPPSPPPPLSPLGDGLRAPSGAPFWTPPPFLAKSEQTARWRVRVIGLDGCSVRSMPRVAALRGGGGISGQDSNCILRVDSFLFHGLQRVPSTLRSTSRQPLHASPRWDEVLAAGGGCDENRVCNLPRETRVAFVVWACPRAEAAPDGAAGAGGSDAGGSLGGGDGGGGGGSGASSSRAGRLRGNRGAPKDAGSGGGVDKANDTVVAYVVQNLFDEAGVLLAGRRSIPLWAPPARKKDRHGKLQKTVYDHDEAAGGNATKWDFVYRASNRAAHTTTNSTPQSLAKPARILIDFDAYIAPVYAPGPAATGTGYVTPNARVVGDALPLPTGSKLRRLERLIAADMLMPMSNSDKALLWLLRHHLVRYPRALGRFLQSVNWCSPDYVNDAHRLLMAWAPPASPVDALELLNVTYADTRVRCYALSHIARLLDCELQPYLLQLVQCLKFEAYHDSPLKRFLVERALRAPLTIGHSFFWHCKAELNDVRFCERYALVLEEFICHAGAMGEELVKQARVLGALQEVAEMVVRLKRDEGSSDDEAKKKYRAALHKLNADLFEPLKRFQVPLRPAVEATTLIVDKCRYMSSKMVPLWLTFHNADPGCTAPVVIMFKSGDDLRQDILTLQLLRIMDRVWLRQGLDMRLKPYGCIATGTNKNGDGVGLIEIVTGSNTTSGIQLEFGGGAMGALKLNPIQLYVEKYNPHTADYETAIENFVRSCAGYCVASFVLGIGDRHNGNIMVTESGHLFHIDFGHFLGNFKTKFGIRRERAAFVFTPEMAFVIGGKKYRKNLQKFKKLCCDAFHTLRKCASLLESLFILMVSAGMPELLVADDVDYLRQKLLLELSDAQAEEELKKEIQRSLDSTYRRFDNFVHNMKHR